MLLNLVTVLLIFEGNLGFKAVIADNATDSSVAGNVSNSDITARSTTNTTNETAPANYALKPYEKPFYGDIRKKFFEKCTLASSEVEDAVTELELRRNMTKPIRSGLFLVLYTVSEINDLDQTLSIFAKLSYQWALPCSGLTPADIPGVPPYDVNFKYSFTIYRNISDGWYPGLIHLNAVRQSDICKSLTNTVSISPLLKNPLFKIESTGIIHSNCEGFSFTKFPFDTLNCSIIIQSLYFAHQMNFAESDILFFIEDGYKPLGDSDIWYMKEDLKFSVQPIFSQFYNSTQQRIYFTMVFKRRYQYFISNIFLPMIILFLLQVSVLFLSPELPDRSNFCVTIVLTLAVSLALIVQLIPRTSERVYLLEILEAKIGVCALITFYTLLSPSLSKSYWGKTFAYSGKFVRMTNVRLLDMIVGFCSLVAVGSAYAAYTTMMLTGY